MLDKQSLVELADIYKEKYNRLIKDNAELERQIDEANVEVERLRKERDEARQEVCGLLVACHTDPDDEKPDPNLKHVHAGIRGWDCFKDNL